jgi:hypothetical protein
MGVGDIAYLKSVGKIVDNAEHPNPLCCINVTNFGIYYFNVYKNVWFKFQVDQDEVRLKKIPKYFKYSYLGEDKYLLVGGFDVESNASSNKVFIYQDGHFTRCTSLITARQYFALAQDSTHIYVLGGFHNEQGVLASCERMQILAKSWEEIEPLNIPRLNAAASRVGDKYIYLFGGTTERGFVDIIERYNMDLNIWTQLDIALPERMSNLTVLPIGAHMLMLFGGLKYNRAPALADDKGRGSEQPRQELDKNVYLFDTHKHNVMMRAFCQFKKKLQSAQINGRGHIYCLYMNSNQELPSLFIADINEIYPDYSPYSWMFKLTYRDPKLDKVVIGKHSKHSKPEKREEAKKQEEFLAVELSDLQAHQS